jgi:hypothetical protein
MAAGPKPVVQMTSEILLIVSLDRCGLRIRFGPPAADRASPDQLPRQLVARADNRNVDEYESSK